MYFATRSLLAGRAGLDLAGAERDREVGDRRVLGLARAVRHDRRVAVLVREPHGLDRLGQRPDLVDLDQDRVGDSALDAEPQPLRVRDEDVVADELQAVAEPLGRGAPAVPVVLGVAVLERDEREARRRGRRRSRPSPPARARAPRSGSGRRRRTRSTPGRERWPPGRDGRPARRRRGSPRSRSRSTRGRARSRPRRRRRSRARAPRAASSARGTSPPRSAAPSEKLSAPAGTTMNSCRSIELSAWTPPLITFSIGTGSVVAPSPPRWRKSETPASAAAAFALASETPRIALAPRRPLFGVPSSSISARSSRFLVRSRRARATASAISPLTFATALETPLPLHALAAVAQLDRLVHAGRGAGRDDRPARARRRRPRPRPSGCRGSREPDGREPR